MSADDSGDCWHCGGRLVDANDGITVYICARCFIHYDQRLNEIHAPLVTYDEEQPDPANLIPTRGRAPRGVDD
jgi:hypothetical protein